MNINEIISSLWLCENNSNGDFLQYTKEKLSPIDFSRNFQVWVSEQYRDVMDLKKDLKYLWKK